MQNQTPNLERYILDQLQKMGTSVPAAPCFTNGTIRLKVSGIQTETEFIPLRVELSSDETTFPIGSKPDLTGFTETACISCCN